MKNHTKARDDKETAHHVQSMEMAVKTADNKIVIETWSGIKRLRD
jgi:hypothetical protein